MFDQFYHGTLRRYVIAFGSLFNDISLVRTASDDSEIHRIKVPISYGPKEKYLVRLAQDPTLTNPVAIVLPRISFEISTIQYDSARKLNRMNRRTHSITGNQAEAYRQYIEVPYNIGFSLSILTKTTEDGMQILEQILPYWTPDYTVTVRTIPEMGLSLDVPIVLNSVNQQDVYEGDMTTRRAMTWSLNFTMKAAVYGPVKQKKIIRDVQVDTFVVSGDGIMEPADYIRTEAGERITLEDESGFVLNEADEGDLAEVERASRVRVRPDPLGAEPGDDYDINTEIDRS